MADTPAPNAVVRAILYGQVRHLLTIAGTAAIAHGLATSGQVDQAIPAAADYITGAAFVVAPMAWSAISKLAQTGRLAAALTALRGQSHPPAPIAPADPAALPPAIQTENIMSLSKEIAKALGIIAGIFIPGTNKGTTTLTHSIQQEVADWAGVAAQDLAAKLALDATMSGPDKIFAITSALVQTALAKGVKADADLLFTVLLDVAQAAYRASLPNIETGIVALAAAFSSNPLVGVAAELVGEEVQALLTKWGGPSPSSALAVPAAA